MLNKFATIVLVAALVCTLAGTHAFADTPNNRDAKTRSAAELPDAVTEARRPVNEELN